jgi:hypothetical protein
MKAYEYITPSGETLNLKLTVAGVIDIEKRTGKSISDLMTEFDKLSVSSVIVACSLPDGTYKEREEKAISIFEELVENEKTIVDYQLIVLNIIKNAGFLTAQRMKAYETLIAKQEFLLGKNVEAIQK